MLTRAAALAALLSLVSSTAFAASAGVTFGVGAVVTRSATVTFDASPDSAGGTRIRQVAARNTPPPMLLVANQLKPMPASGVVLPSGSNREQTVTLMY